ncbi:acyl-CoA N-acyltransferases (NAT) superfamily protein [Actinidia rufa]|uniref:Acyl-CoA N-acyltransferases (NAT) superfamily protein n=1 Tax=Actinidia rufa TaxID=165716 RepID=A0A7J0G7I7_9ERIC|nr:acyl-CoA N-acyltransferases (NAT) superfamily protein [Actinidia rufa]
MAVLTASPPLPLLSRSSSTTTTSSSSFSLSFPVTAARRRLPTAVASHLCNPTKLDKSALIVAEATSEDELWAAACLRIRTFRNFRESVGIEDHKRYLAEREFEAIKERVAGKRTGFRRVSCINATLPLSHVLSFSDDLCSACKFSEDGEERVLVGSLDLNQCLSLPEEIIGMKPQEILQTSELRAMVFTSRGGRSERDVLLWEEILELAFLVPFQIVVDCLLMVSKCYEQILMNAAYGGVTNGPLMWESNESYDIVMEVEAF